MSAADDKWQTHMHADRRRSAPPIDVHGDERRATRGNVESEKGGIAAERDDAEKAVVSRASKMVSGRRSRGRRRHESRDLRGCHRARAGRREPRGATLGLTALRPRPTAFGLRVVPRKTRSAPGDVENARSVISYGFARSTSHADRSGVRHLRMGRRVARLRPPRPDQFARQRFAGWSAADGPKRRARGRNESPSFKPRRGDRPTVFGRP